MYRPALALGVLLLAGACSRHRTEQPAPTGTPVRVVAHNNFSGPMEVYAIGAGTRYRLGLVQPGTTQTFTIPTNIISIGSVELMAQLIAGRSRVARTGPLLLSPGAVVDFMITAQLFDSYGAIRP